MASQPKTQKIDGEEEALQDVIEKIDEVQSAIDTLNENASEDILRIEQKYNKLRSPYYSNRTDLISSIPNFWVQTFLNHPQIMSVLIEEDELILQHLTKLDVQVCDEIKTGYKLLFYFSKNDWFTNDCLVKEFTVSEVGEPISKATTISWHPGKDVTNKGVKPSAANGSLKRGISETGAIPGGGFFSWFNEPKNVLGDEFGEVIKDDIWANPLQYYLAHDMEEEEEESEEDLDDEEEALDEDGGDFEQAE